VAEAAAAVAWAVAVGWADNAASELRTKHAISR